jgi:membrane fusion protein, heavy metal efflux system
VTWISPVADERTRSVQVRAELGNADRSHRAGEFGAGRIVLREEKSSLVVPSEAVHWEGDCNVVFVRDKDYEKDGAAKVFHVRQVRPGAKDVVAGRAVTEIAGLAPGEWVAVANSGLFRSELLKNFLGAG